MAQEPGKRAHEKSEGGAGSRLTQLPRAWSEGLQSAGAACAHGLRGVAPVGATSHGRRAPGAQSASRRVGQPNVAAAREFRARGFPGQGSLLSGFRARDAAHSGGLNDPGNQGAQAEKIWRPRTQEVWKQDRLAYALATTADLLNETHDYRAALANLDESKRIIERLGISDKGRMDTYALALTYSGEANRAIGNEQAACEQDSKARDLYRKLSFSRSNSGALRLAYVERALAPCARR